MSDPPDGAVGAQEAGGRVHRIGRVVGAGRVGAARGDRFVVGGEGRRLELHRAFSPGCIGAAVDTGQVRLSVVGLDSADRSEHRPRQARARSRRPLVERQHGDRDLRGDRRRRRRLDVDTEHGHGRADHGRAQQPDHQAERQQRTDGPPHRMYRP